jgi:hypothetical protein
MPGSDPQQGYRGTFGLAPTLLPVSESMNADPHGESKLHLSEPDKTSQRRDVFAGFKLPLHQTLSNPCGNRPCELFLGQLRNFSHRLGSM